VEFKILTYEVFEGNVFVWEFTLLELLRDNMRIK